MKETTFLPKDKAQLRHIAEKRMSEQKSGAGHPDTESDLKMLLHELQVHQIELEMQNDELRRIQEDLEAEKERYTDLYEFAPVGYMTLNEQGVILEGNLTAATLLGIPRNELIKKPLTGFILPEDQDIYHHHRSQLTAGVERQICELRMQRPKREPFWARLEATAVRDGRSGPLECRVVIIDITERKQAEDALRTSEWFLRSTLDGLSAHIAVLDDRGEIILTNRAYRDFAERNGIEPGAVSEGINYLAVCDTAQDEDSEGAGAFARGIREVLSGKRRYFELEYPCHSPGEKRWFVGRVTPFSGEGLRQVVVAHDNITERKRAEDSLSQSEAKFRQYFEVSPNYVYIVSREGTIIDANPAAVLILGYSSNDELIGRPLLDTVYAPSSRDKARELFRRWRETGMLENEELRILSGAGEERTIILNVSAVRDGHGQVLHSVSFQTDITERKKLEESWKRSEFIVNSTSELLTLINRNYIYEEANYAYCESLGRTREDIVGRSVVDIWGERRYRDIIKVKIDQCLEGAPVSDEGWVVFPGGVKRYLSINYYPYSASGKEITHVTVVSHDISKRKESEDALRKSEARLTEAQQLARIGNWEMDIPANRLIWSDEIYKIFELDPGEFDASFESFIEVIHPEDRKKVKLAYINSLNRKVPYDIVHRLLMPDGRVKYVHARSDTHYDSQGHPLRSIGTMQDITEQQVAQEALKQSEEKYRNVFENVVEGLYRTTPAGRFVIINPAFARICGYESPEEMMERIGDIANQLYADPEDRLRFQKLIAAEGEVKGFEVRFRNPTKGLVWVSIYSKAICDEQGKIQYYDGTIEDITARRQAEDALRRSEENFRRSLEESPLGMRIVDSYGDTIHANRAILDLYGYAGIDELINTPVKKRYTPESYEAFQARREKRKRGIEDAPSYEIGIVRKTGEIRHLHVHRKKIEWDGKDQYLVLYQDITKRRQAEISLLRSNERLLIAQAAAKAGMWDWDIVTGHIDWSDSLYELFGLSPLNSDASFEAWKNVIHPDDREIAGKRIDETLQQKKELNSDYRVVLPDGRIRWINAVGKGEYDEHGQPLRMIGICLDITGRREAEDALLRQHIQLQRLSSRLVEAEEAERKRITRELHDQVGQNLTALGINLNILRTITSGESNDKIKRSLDESLALVKQTTEFTRNLMAELRPPVMDDYGLMASIKWYGERFAARTGIAFNMKSVDLIPRPKGLFEVTLFRIIQEALTNAGKHAGASRIDVEGEIINNKLRITVVDNGRGFDKRLFTRADGSFSWGIMTMIERAQSMGGNLTVESQPGRGTKVVVEVPV